MFKRELIEKAKELAKTNCPIKGTLCGMGSDGKVCYCTTGLILLAAGYKPVLKTIHFLYTRWRTPSHHTVDTAGAIKAFDKLANEAGTSVYEKIYFANDSAQHDYAFVDGLAVAEAYTEPATK
jgi:hypothetical protein